MTVFILSLIICQQCVNIRKWENTTIVSQKMYIDLAQSERFDLHSRDPRFDFPPQSFGSKLDFGIPR